MKLCLISKYPPIEGGVSSRTYWLAKALGERGNEIHVVTNAWEVESEYREHFEVEDIDKYQPKNVMIHNTNPFMDLKYIPYSKPYTEKIASLTIDVIREYDIELIDSWYIIPYAISAYLAKVVTNKPQILRHAGSDISRFLNSHCFNTLFTDVLKRVDKIVTYPDMKPLFLRIGVPEKKIFLNIKNSVDTTIFHPNVKPFNLSVFTKRYNDGLPIITYIGKIGSTKGIYELTEALSRIDKDFILLFVSGGREFQKLTNDVKNKKLDDKTIFLGFLPPWQIPGIIKISTCVVIPERDFPIATHTPILPREVMCVGRCTLLSEEIFNKRKYRELEDGTHTLVINPKNINQFREKLESVIKYPSYADEIGRNARKLTVKYEKFDVYIDSMEALYQEVIG